MCVSVCDLTICDSPLTQPPLLLVQSVLPFAVVASSREVPLEGGKRGRGREYPWGTVEIANTQHSDFNKLRIFLLR